ncbi:phosphate/phosphite/phosphonate ABC transporter substrate-binding protein [Sulfuriflexus mobilis]|uniref:phosphate/phosphite/phosphonate ABC transporter substrate-binding protein n=1 Tax=Sulfuriflexus mobilis TaxID=1811807 RepID=UPI000F83B4E6|nr:PhnD/SsuA/transferrin family substrate-binding protein [Sulfuriflexus mobilis]
MNNPLFSVCYKTKKHWLRNLIIVLGLGLFPPLGQAAEYNFVVQPILPPEQTKEAFQPLTDYLSQQTGHDIKLITAINFLSYWETMKKNTRYDLILDAAHLTDYRAKRMAYKILAKRADAVSYTLVTGEGADILDPEELIGKSIASIGSPSLGMLRVEEMFPNPLRQPVIVEVNNSVDSIKKVIEGKAIGAMVPTPLVGQYPELVTITVTEQVPHTAISASSRVPQDVQNAIRKALLDADKTPEGQAMLEAINFPSFEAATPEQYAGYASLLEGIWGY